MTPRPGSRLVCAGCGRRPDPDDPAPFRCPAAGEGDVDHVLRRKLDADRVRDVVGDAGRLFDAPEPNPFLRYRKLLHSWWAARERGSGDDLVKRIVAELDDEIRRVGGESEGFRETPFHPVPELAASLGLDAEALWVKDETGNVSGSHKARHLAGILLWLRLVEEAAESPTSPPGLAIASCGNAALAASVVARAARRRLSVFVPPHAPPSVVARMEALGAEIVACPREPGVPGDPCVHRMERAVEAGAIPFTCQGDSNGLTIEGGQTLAWEIVSALRRTAGVLDRVFVQVGGGALATACIRGFAEAVELGVLDRMPKIHAVQTANAHPLVLAWHRFALELGIAGSDPEAAERIARLPTADLETALRVAATHRSRFMRPWPEEPRSLAGGILDDETYDWLAVVEGMARTGGWPVTADEATLREAWTVGRRATGIPAEPTGTAGLAGLLRLVAQGHRFEGERVAVLFTGVER